MFTYLLPVRRFAFRHRTGNSCIAAWENSSMFIYLLPVRRFTFRHLTGKHLYRCLREEPLSRRTGERRRQQIRFMHHLGCSRSHVRLHFNQIYFTYSISSTYIQNHSRWGVQKVKMTSDRSALTWLSLITFVQPWHDYQWSPLYSPDMIINDHLCTALTWLSMISFVRPWHDYHWSPLYGPDMIITDHLCTALTWLSLISFVQPWHDYHWSSLYSAVLCSPADSHVVLFMFCWAIQLFS